MAFSGTAFLESEVGLLADAVLGGDERGYGEQEHGDLPEDPPAEHDDRGSDDGGDGSGSGHQMLAVSEGAQQYCYGQTYRELSERIHAG